MCVPERCAHSQKKKEKFFFSTTVSKQAQKETTKKKKNEEKSKLFSIKNSFDFSEKLVSFGIASKMLTVWPLSNYGFGSKACESPGRDRSEAARLERLRAR